MNEIQREDSGSSVAPSDLERAETPVAGAGGFAGPGAKQDWGGASHEEAPAAVTGSRSPGREGDAEHAQPGMGSILSAAVRAVIRRQQLVMANLMGNAFLLFVLYSWAVMNDLSMARLRQSAPLLVGVGFFLTWLSATTFAAFQTNSEETPFVPALKRLPHYLPWETAMFGIVALCYWLSAVVSFVIWIAGLGVFFAILPFASQAAGGGFSQSNARKIVCSDRYWVLTAGLLVVGLYLPLTVLLYTGGSDQIVAGALLAGAKIGAVYFLAVGAWMTLAAVIGTMGMTGMRGPITKTGPESALDRHVEFPFEKKSCGHRDNQKPDQPVGL